MDIKPTELKLIKALREAGGYIQFGEVSINITFKNGGIKKMEVVDKKKIVLLD